MVANQEKKRGLKLRAALLSNVSIDRATTITVVITKNAVKLIHYSALSFLTNLLHIP